VEKKKKITTKKKNSKKIVPKETSTIKKAPKVQKIKKKKKVNYLNNKDILFQVALSKEDGMMNNRLAHMLQTLTARYAKRGSFAGYCVDDQTTALTKRGWLSCEQITTDDEILSYDVTTKGLVWSKINELYINHEYEGPMDKLDTQGMDALVTPSHKFVSVERGIVPVEDIICNEHITLMGSPTVTDFQPKYTDAFVELVGWVVTEGHYLKGSKQKHMISIYQQEGERADRIRTCLCEGDVHYKEYNFSVTSPLTNRPVITFNCSGKDISTIYNTIAPNRVLTLEFILSLTHHQRLLLINTMINADGWFRPNGGMSYVQKDTEHVDTFLALCTLSGLTTSSTQMEYATPKSRKHPDGGSSLVTSINIYKKPKLYCKSERIDFHGGRASPGGRRDQKANITTQQYKGTIWCPRTDYGTFVCRRNKYIYVTGNTYNEDMQAYAMMMLVKTWNNFNPEKSNNPFAFFTQCIKNSFLQFLKVEKNQRNIRDKMLVNQGMNPSHTYQIEHESSTSLSKNENKKN